MQACGVCRALSAFKGWYDGSNTWPS